VVIHLVGRQCTVETMATIRELSDVELERIPEMDVSEEGASVYVQRGASLELVRRAHRRPPRSVDEWRPEVLRWQGFVRDGGRAFGAFDGEWLVGVAVLRDRLTDDTAQLAGLYVDRDRRRRGVASALLDAVATTARGGGASVLYVSAVPSDSAVGFYLSRGFEPTASPHPDLFELEPEDVHMLLRL
jgi:GNAT superfamily N-acetyltransferase